MAILQSIEMALVSSQQLVPVAKLGSRVRYAEFNFTVGLALSQNDVIELTQIQRDAKILRGYFTFGTGVASSTISLGIQKVDGSIISATQFLTNKAVATAGGTAFADFTGNTTTKVGALTPLPYDSKIIATVSNVAGLKAGQVFTGIIEYVLD